MAQKYKLIYCARILDDKHAGMLKIGDTEFTPTKPIHKYEPNENALKKEAESRIRSWSGTAAAGAELVYCEALIRYNTNTENYETYRDSEVHTVLQHSGFPKVDFDSALDSGREWFTVDLNTVVAAIKATKEYRDYLDTSELPKKDIYDLRDEQEKAVKDTIARFKKKDDMLWHAKMRFGKTITALNLVKREGFKRTIIITHRPVVEDSWGSDFYHVFSGEDKYAFLTKIQNAEYVLSDDETDESIDKANDVRLAQLVAQDRSFVYFASIQDLRGSKRVGGNFDKNNIVFDIDWDLVIIDEAHEGTKTELGQKVISLLIKEKTKKLDLSGTAYNLFDKYTEEGSVYTWDYVMEQEAKRKWPELHPGEKNPYEDMPVMHINTFDLARAIKEHGLDLSGKSFSFREFFRTWTGDLSKDGQPIPVGSELGDFVHAAAVRRFLDLLSQGDESSKFPYVTKDKCNQNRHSLWMVPGVKEAAALSKMLKKHPLFGQEAAFGIANVAGEGDHDEEKNYHNALEHVRKTIANHPNSITLSCGRLTTGVTVKEWTSVFMLSGSETTDAKNYMQTIFRVQSAGKIDGVQKKDAYVYDFAPDRTLLVIAATVLGSKRKGRGGTVIDDDDRHKAFSDFLEFCPIVAIDGAEFKPFGVESLVSQINRVQIDRALETGFTDNGIYDMSKFKSLNAADIDKMNSIFQKLKETKNTTPLTSAGMAKNGTEKGKKAGKKGSGGTPTKTKDEEKEQKALEKNILEKLRTISIRIPLLFFGGDFEIEAGRLGEVITSIDQVSWNLFMPENLTKKDFLALVKYYNQETVIGAARVIRGKALEADGLPPTERVIAITEIFSHFHNPAKETVLTPWRVVNMHMADTLGGWCFYNEGFEENDDEYYKRLITPRFVNQGAVTDYTANNPSATFLEINSKSGLYPLYACYSLYRAKMGVRKESDLLPSELLEIWDSALSQVYVLCQSSMARSITNRTLIGFRSVSTNVKYDEKLLDYLKKSIPDTAKRIIKGSYWGKEVKQMKFDAVIGNPPYQELTNGGGDTGRAAKQAAPIFNLFVEQAKQLAPNYVSMIIPARWYNGGIGLSDFRTNMLNDQHITKLVDFINSKDCFPTVDIGGGLCYFLWNKHEQSECTVVNVSGGNRNEMHRSLDQFGSFFIRSNKAISIISKVRKKATTFVSDMVSAIDTFGIPSKVRGKEEPFEGAILLVHSDGANSTKTSYIERSVVAKNEHLIDKYKIRISILVPQNGEAGVRPEKGYRSISTPHIVYPGEVDSFSYLNIGFFDTEIEAENFRKYMMCKFPRFMLRTTYSSAHVSQANFVFVPHMDFTQAWDDKTLYKYFELSDDEIKLIEDTMRPMDN